MLERVLGRSRGRVEERVWEGKELGNGIGECRDKDLNY